MPVFYARSTKVRLCMASEERSRETPATLATDTPIVPPRPRYLTEDALVPEGACSLTFLGAQQDMPFYMVRAGRELYRNELDEPMRERRSTNPSDETLDSSCCSSEVTDTDTMGNQGTQGNDASHLGEKTLPSHATLQVMQAASRPGSSSMRSTVSSVSSLSTLAGSIFDMESPSLSSFPPNQPVPAGSDHPRTSIASPLALTPSGLTLEIELSKLSFASYDRKGKLLDLQIAIFYNGEFTACRMISSRMAIGTPGPDVLLHTFSGRRVGRTAERRWMVVPPGQDADGTTRPSVDAEDASVGPRQRWISLGQALQQEADRWGWNQQGNRSVVGDYLISLAQLDMPAVLEQMPTSGGQTYGIVDVVIMLGEGQKHPANRGYLKAPQRALDPKYQEGIPAMDRLVEDFTLVSLKDKKRRTDGKAEKIKIVTPSSARKTTVVARAGSLDVIKMEDSWPSPRPTTAIIKPRKSIKPRGKTARIAIKRSTPVGPSPATRRGSGPCFELNVSSGSGDAASMPSGVGSPSNSVVAGLTPVPPVVTTGRTRPTRPTMATSTARKAPRSAKDQFPIVMPPNMTVSGPGGHMYNLSLVPAGAPVQPLSRSDDVQLSSSPSVAMETVGSSLDQVGATSTAVPQFPGPGEIMQPPQMPGLQATSTPTTRASGSEFTVAIMPPKRPRASSVSSRKSVPGGPRAGMATPTVTLPSSSRKAPVVVASPSTSRKAPAVVTSPSSARKAPAVVSSPSSARKAPTVVASPSSTRKAPVVVASPNSSRKAPVVVTSPSSSRKTPVVVTSSSSARKAPAAATPASLPGPTPSPSPMSTYMPAGPIEYERRKKLRMTQPRPRSVAPPPVRPLSVEQGGSPWQPHVLCKNSVLTYAVDEDDAGESTSTTDTTIKTNLTSEWDGAKGAYQACRSERGSDFVAYGVLMAVRFVVG